MSTPNSQGLPTALTVISANIEGLTDAKASMLSVMCKDKHCLVARCLETIYVCIWRMFVFMSVVVIGWGSVGMFVV